MKSVYSVVWSGALNKAVCASSLRVKFLTCRSQHESEYTVKLLTTPSQREFIAQKNQSATQQIANLLWNLTIQDSIHNSP